MGSALAESPTSARKGRNRQSTPRKLDRAKVQELHAKGLNTVEIAKHQGVNPSTVWRFLERTKPEVQALERFKSGRADALAALGADALEVQNLALKALKHRLGDGISSALEPGQITKILQAAAMAHGIGFDKERLERGESTANISTVSRMIDGAVSALYKRKSAIDNGMSSASESDT
jgi:hypothetical protein